MTTNNYQQLNLKNKNKLSKQLQQEQNHRYEDHLEGYQQGGRGRMGLKTGSQKHNWQVQNRQGEVKNSTGNVEAKELICMIHGHELKWRGMLEDWGGAGQRGIKVAKWDNCNTIIKIYF